MRVHNQPGDFNFFLGHQGIAQKARQRHLGQSHLRRNTLARGVSGHTGEQVA
jgi:hypothetical protein